MWDYHRNFGSFTVKCEKEMGKVKQIIEVRLDGMSFKMNQKPLVFHWTSEEHNWIGSLY